MVITGASSGIGLATALMAAQRGAKLVLIARSGSSATSRRCATARARCTGRTKTAARTADPAPDTRRPVGTMTGPHHRRASNVVREA
ncbi:SDR family NAD(P)-dependent oxidoreductase [Cognatilysobacter lacus]|uniref:SDR family NAD(P)-dependent oxidoreductase n=1 Tax=Cognatilysobacter lacus TaxID=1643323 RepID=UPI001961BFEA|nr:SDR family NAD(P)-dependent oxidoreductase [Lysobacter lacus]